MVTIERINGEFQARVGTLVLHKGKGTKAINLCHDMKDALSGLLPRVIGVGTRTFDAGPGGDHKQRREYFVMVSGVTLIASSNAKRVYDFCDELNRLLGLVPRGEMPAVPVPDAAYPMWKHTRQPGERGPQWEVPRAPEPSMAGEPDADELNLPVPETGAGSKEQTFEGPF